MFFQRNPSITPSEAAEPASRPASSCSSTCASPPSVREAHVEGATNIPLGRAARTASASSTAAPIAFICRSGARSAMATACRGRRPGYDAVNVKGGMIAWARAGLPLTRKETR